MSDGQDSCPQLLDQPARVFYPNHINLISAHWATSCLCNTVFGHEDRLHAGVSLNHSAEQRTDLLIQPHPVRFVHTHTHLLQFAGHVCAKADSSSCLVFCWFYWCRRRQQWVVVSPMCVCECECVWPWYTDEPLPLLEPGCVHAYFHSWYIRPQMAVEWSWSFQRWGQIAFPPWQLLSQCQAAQNVRWQLDFFLPLGKQEAVKSYICLF